MGAEAPDGLAKIALGIPFTDLVIGLTRFTVFSDMFPRNCIDEVNMCMSSRFRCYHRLKLNASLSYKPLAGFVMLKPNLHPLVVV